ncbi:MAG: excisionase [Lachnospiraceae bacterium]|nr:excisionase [Lachnospiraceae bacterium]
MEKTTISVQELSAQMGISLQKAYELVKSPGFPTIRVGTRILVPVEGYRNWLLKQSGDDTEDASN